jgi:hypothetical protein
VRSGDNLTAFALFPAKVGGEDGVGQERTVRIASLIGANGGYVPTGDNDGNKSARGVGGVWNLDNTHYKAVFGDDDAAKQFSLVTSSSNVVNSSTAAAEADNTKYLNLNPYGEYSLSGSIFLDSRNSSNFTDDYSILYGHHMEYGKMFGALDEFLNMDYMQRYSTGKLIVGRDGSRSYDLGIFACMKVNVYDNKALDPDTFENVMKMIEDEAPIYNTSIEKGSRILVLSTCTEPVSTNRLLVFCYIYD